MTNTLTITVALLLALSLLLAFQETEPMPCVRLGNMPIAGACH